MDWTLLGFKGLGQVVNIHPVFVHFPVALFPVSWLFYFVGAIFKKEKFLFVGRFSLYLAFLAAAVAVLTGELAEKTFQHTETVHRLMETHEAIGISALIVAGILVLWSFWTREGRPQKTWGFLALLGLVVLMVLQNADLGGRMVFVEGAAVQKIVPRIESPHPHEHHHH